MKAIQLLILIILGLIISSCSNSEKKKSISQNIDLSISKIEVFDFHSTHRCMTCNAIEENTTHTLNKYFKEELKSGLVEFHIINVDEQENTKIAEKFEATGTSLILNVINKGQETQLNLTDFAFRNGTNQDVFSKELKAKIDLELKAL